MTWIATIPPDDADGELKEAYAEQFDVLGFPSNFYQALSLKPDSMVTFWKLGPTLGIGSTSLGLRKEELIATTVSALNSNRYCTNGHGERLREHIGDSTDDLRQDWRSVDLPADERAMLAFCEKATLRPAPMTEQDVQDLRAAGFSDTQVLEIVLMIGMRLFCNVIGDALGIEPYFEVKKDPA